MYLSVVLRIRGYTPPPLTPFHGACIGLSPPFSTASFFSSFPLLPSPVSQLSPEQENSGVLVTTVGRRKRGTEKGTFRGTFCLDLPSQPTPPRNVVAPLRRALLDHDSNQPSTHPPFARSALHVFARGLGRRRWRTRSELSYRIHRLLEERARRRDEARV